MTDNPYESPGESGKATEPQRPQRPIMVKLGLWGLPAGGSAVAFMWFSFACAAASVVVGILFWPALFGILLSLAGLWYWLAIRWVDQHDDWK